MAGLGDLAGKACRGDRPVLKGDALAGYLDRVDGWEAVEEHPLRRTFRFPDFVGAMEFVNRVGAVAEAEQHHPNITLTWGRATIEIWTHKVDGLTESDFILAAKIDTLGTS